MSFLVVLVVDDPDNCPAIMDAWEEAGVTGITILESSGLGRVRRAAMRDDLPLLPGLRDIFGSSEVHHRTLLTVVDSQEKVDRLVEVSQQVTGDLDQPDTGVLFVVPVLQVYGLNRKDLKP